MNFLQRKHNLLSNIEKLRFLAQEVVATSLYPKINTEIQKLQDERFHLVVLGQFKRGKTTLINAILGEPLLPVAVVPLTSILTLIHFGEAKCIEVIFQDHKRLTIDASELEDYVTERGNPKNEKHVYYVEIQYPSEFLQGGIVLIDTPGIGSLFLHNTATTYEFIPDIDAAIFLLSADLPMTQAEYQFLEEVRKYVSKIYFVLNKIDILSPEDLSESVAYNRDVLRKQLGKDEIDLYPLSARVALEKKDGNNSINKLYKSLIDFKIALKYFFENERRSVLLYASEQRIRSYMLELRFVIELELKSNELPLKDLQKKIVLFENQLVSVHKDQSQFSYLLSGELSTLEHWINEELEEFKVLETNILKEKLSEWIDKEGNNNGDLSLNEARQKLADMLIDDFNTWRKLFEPKLITKYEKVAGEFINKINGLIDNLHKISGKLFDIIIEPYNEFESFKWKKTFTYSVEDGALFLEIEPMKIIKGVLSKKVFKRKIQKILMKEIEEKVERNCGRLRYEYTYSLQESARKFQRDIDTEVEHIIAGIENILHQAVNRKKESEHELQSQIDLIRNRLTKLKEIEQGLTVAL